MRLGLRLILLRVRRVDKFGGREFQKGIINAIATRAKLLVYIEKWKLGLQEGQVRSCISSLPSMEGQTLPYVHFLEPHGTCFARELSNVHSLFPKLQVRNWSRRLMNNKTFKIVSKQSSCVRKFSKSPDHDKSSNTFPSRQLHESPNVVFHVNASESLQTARTN